VTSASGARGGGKVLVVDDAIENLNLLAAILEGEGLEVMGAPSAEVALQLVRRSAPDLAILDILMPGIDGLTLCQMLGESTPRRLPVIFVSGREDTETIVKAFAVGAVDYITKPIQEREVIARVGCHLKIARLQAELETRHQALLAANKRLEEQIQRRERAEAELTRADERASLLREQEAARWGVDGFVGQSPAMRHTCDEVQRLAAFTRTHVLILGESGSGKELVARALHRGGPRREGPFIAVNCSAIPLELAESTFFGHVRGAFTGASNDRKGCFDLADHGTLFLDEIADLPPLLQAKLLRTLEDGTFSPVGSAREHKSDVRIVCATHADLEVRAREGAFRQDLYFRLAQYTVRVPPLRERREDIPLLVQHFLRLFSTDMNMRCPEVTADALDRLVQHDFPGNVRELRNISERALIVSGGGQIERRHIELGGAAAAGSVRAALETLNLDEVKTQLLERALRIAEGNVSAAAKLLGVHRSWFYRNR
jgi:DNA-binding NtrC family response regulator